MFSELNKADFAQYGYVPGSLESNMYDGKLYGIPVSADFWVIYYNKQLFKQAGVAAPPKTIEELEALAPKFKAKGIIPMVTDGKDAWPLSITYDVLCERVNGDFSRQQAALDRKAKFTDPDFVEGARQYSEVHTIRTVPGGPDGVRLRRLTQPVWPGQSRHVHHGSVGNGSCY